MATKALPFLDSRTRTTRKGFFLQMEVASIDEQDHAANPCGRIGETVAFDAAVRKALEHQCSRLATLVVVTADDGHASQIVESATLGSTATLTTHDGINGATVGAAAVRSGPWGMGCRRAFRRASFARGPAAWDVAHGVGMRIALVTESFLPDVNGVASSVVRVAEQLVARGHHPMVIAPQPQSGGVERMCDLPYPVVRMPSLPMPGYPQVRLGLPTPALTTALRDHRTDVVHLASPFVLGAWGSAAARALRLPSIAVYQTDVAAYARAYRVPMSEGAAWRWIRTVHNTAGRTLAPSTESVAGLSAHGVKRVHLWRHAVDCVRFDPRHRGAALRRVLAPKGEVLVGFVGRLAVEKQVGLLAGVARLPGVRLVVVGDGPAAGSLRRELPTAVFLGARHGAQLARIYASFDVFAHTGPYETFGLAIQEAMASGLPVVAPAAGGPVDLVAPGVTGHLVPPFHADGFTRAVADLAADPACRARFGAAARASVEMHSWAAVGDELLGHYHAVVDDSVPARVDRVTVAASPR